MTTRRRPGRSPPDSVHAIERAWYQGAAWIQLLTPLEWLYRFIVVRRRRAFLAGQGARYRAPVPVLIVGNITVGGTGKTPLVAWLVEALRDAGFRPGVVSRGYGGQAPSYPWVVYSDTPPTLAGDEPVLLVQRTGCPLVVDPDRGRAVRRLLTESDCDVVISDDGLQHYQLDRDIEIVVIDGMRGLGNGRCLPVGPLREPADRLRQVDLIVTNGETSTVFPRAAHAMTLEPGALQPVSAATHGAAPAAGPVHAVAGIGNPGRFFATLRNLGYAVIEHAFPDHHAFQAGDLVFGDGLPVVMTEKDAVKCRELDIGKLWYLPVNATFRDGFAQSLVNLLERARLQLNNPLENQRAG